MLTIPGILLFSMIVLTLLLLPRLNDERKPQTDEPKRVTEEIHVKVKRH